MSDTTTGGKAMTGEELNRKYHELCGWTVVEKPDESIGTYPQPMMLLLLDGYKQPVKWHYTSDYAQREIWKGLPPLHLDANLAIAEADRTWKHWNIGKSSEGDYQFWTRTVDEKAPTFYEAILKALIAAKEQNQ